MQHKGTSGMLRSQQTAGTAETGMRVGIYRCCWDRKHSLRCYGYCLVPDWWHWNANAASVNHLGITPRYPAGLSNDVPDLYSGGTQNLISTTPAIRDVHFLSENFETVPRLVDGRFLPNHFQSIIHHSSYSPDSFSVVK